MSIRKSRNPFLTLAKSWENVTELDFVNPQLGAELDHYITEAARIMKDMILENLESSRQQRNHRSAGWRPYQNGAFSNNGRSPMGSPMSGYNDRPFHTTGGNPFTRNHTSRNKDNGHRDQKDVLTEALEATLFFSNHEDNVFIGSMTREEFKDVLSILKLAEEHHHALKLTQEFLRSVADLYMSMPEFSSHEKKINRLKKLLNIQDVDIRKEGESEEKKEDTSKEETTAEEGKLKRKIDQCSTDLAQFCTARGVPLAGDTSMFPACVRQFVQANAGRFLFTSVFFDKVAEAYVKAADSAHENDLTQQNFYGTSAVQKLLRDMEKDHGQMAGSPFAYMAGSPFAYDPEL